MKVRQKGLSLELIKASSINLGNAPNPKHKNGVWGERPRRAEHAFA
jgi:hypothetical protein